MRSNVFRTAALLAALPFAFSLSAPAAAGTCPTGDTRAPSGTITSPAPGSCFGPSALPVVLTDDFEDDCDPAPQRFLSPEPVYELRLSNPTGAKRDNFGDAAALSGDRLVIGAWSEGVDQTGYPHGSATAFRRVGEGWQVEQVLFPEQLGGLDNFGITMDMDAEVLVIGAPQAAGAGLAEGRVYLYRRQADAWALSEILAPPPPVTGADRFGTALAIGGGRIAVTDQEPNPTMGDAFGVVSIYDAATGLLLDQLRSPTPERFTIFGTELEIDGDRLAIAAETEGGAGVVYVGRFIADRWELEARLAPNDLTSSARFGSALALDGDTLAVGAEIDGRDRDFPGSVHVYERDTAGQWVRSQRIDPPQPLQNARFGAQMDLEGDLLAIAAQTENDRTGAVYVYHREAGTWNPTKRLVAPDGVARTEYGSAVLLDGATLLLGQSGQIIGSRSRGAVHLHRPESGLRYWRHGDYQATLTVQDAAGNAGTDEIAFTIDTVEPLVSIVAPRPNRAVTQDVPFDVIFVSDDDDLASDGQHHEVLQVNGCTTHDGAVYGDGDGLLSDEVLRFDSEAWCSIARTCGFDTLETLEISIRVTDCGGNEGIDRVTLNRSLQIICDE